MTFFSLKCTCLFVKLVKSSSLRRYSGKKNIRVRFAPSPTGLLHLGGLRTALYNYLFAKSQNGATILRIEDTDQSRKIQWASENLIRDLEWCGIKFDEGPYYQSDRIELYKKYATQLLEENKAYYCFCDRSRLELLRKEALKTGEIPRYDNKCRLLTSQEVEHSLRNGEVPCIRFKLSPLDGPIRDLIYDSLSYTVDQFEGDPVILKSDGFPTYHFANVIDDHLMKISHVLRGVEWHVSTAKHVLIYKAFNWDPPTFAHIPLLMNPDGSKLSKRQGDVHIQELREKGYLPNAILNFVVRFGGGFDIEQREKDMKIFEMDELIQRFDLSKLKTYSSKITLSYLDDYNKMEIKRLLEVKSEIPEMVKRVQQILTDYFEASSEQKKTNLDPEYVKLILDKLKSRINKLEDLTSKNFICFWFWNNAVAIEDLKNLTALKKFLVEIDDIDWNIENLKSFIKDFSKKYDLNFPEFMKLLRMVLIENQDGPSIVEILDILGRDVVNYRISNAVAKSESTVNNNLVT